MASKIEIGFAPKTVKLENGEYLHFFYANNKNRGRNNCTIIRSKNPERMGATRLQWADEKAVRMVTTSAVARPSQFCKTRPGISRALDHHSQPGAIIPAKSTDRKPHHAQRPQTRLQE